MEIELGKEMLSTKEIRDSCIAHHTLIIVAPYGAA